jgi:2-polyprenyl-3-methyl-5-hydroxy-6-metoxy-1,4-benzoquinol methylase/ribosomal protein S27E
MNNKKSINENDIRPKDLMVGQKNAMNADIEWLKNMSINFIKVNCPACGSNNTKTLYKKYSLNHLVCKKCLTQYVSPRPTKTILKDFYKNSVNYAYWAKYIFSASADIRKEKIFKPRALFLKENINSKKLNGTLLEIGAAYGYFCEEIKKLNLFTKIIGIEPTPDLANVLRSKKIDVIEKSYEDAVIEDSVDVIVNFEVIEHLFSPKEFLEWCYRKLNPGGCLYLTCPNIGGFETTALSEKSDNVDHEHLNLFNTISIKKLVKSVGFEKVMVKTPGILDYDIVKQAYLSNKINKKELGPFITKLIEDNDRDSEIKFQEYLVKSNSSSHMMCLAYKPIQNKYL